jgi:hypothetical protein
MLMIIKGLNVGEVERLRVVRPFYLGSKNENKVSRLQTLDLGLFAAPPLQASSPLGLADQEIGRWGKMAILHVAQGGWFAPNR